MNMIAKDIISPKLAILAKEKGFKPSNPSTDYVPMYKAIYSDEIDDYTGQYEITDRSEEDWDIEDVFYITSLCSLQTWLRDTHDIHVNVNPKPDRRVNFLQFAYEISTSKNNYSGIDDNLNHWIGLTEDRISDKTYHVRNTHEEALEAGLVEALEMIKS